mgnify:CR=1 FL=1
MCSSDLYNMAKRIDGKAIAAQIKQELKEQVQQLAKDNITVTLAVIQVGQDPASCVYVRNKQRTCEELGIHSLSYELEETTSEEKLLSLIQELNAREDVDGILVQLPLPGHINEKDVLNAIDPAKDVDGFHPINVGKLHLKEDGFVPCTPLGCMELLHRMGINPAGKRAVVLGRSNLVGAPVARLLLNENATVTICHSKTENLPQVCAEADILIAAVGRAKMVTADYVKEGAAVIDVGINRSAEGKLVGDVDFASVEPKAGFITPVPKGVGPMTITMLLKNTLKAYRQHEGE